MSRTPIAEQTIIKLLERYHLLSAVDIVEKMNAIQKPVNKTTVYRTLDKLLAKGDICRHSLGTDTLYYELRYDHHDHAVCESCGDISHLECGKELEKIEQRNVLAGFTPLHHHLTIFGLCQKCAVQK